MILIKVKIKEEFWREGKPYRVGESLLLTKETINEIGKEKFEIKSLENAPFDKMMKTAPCSKEI